MRIYKDHLILSGSKVKEALVALNELSQDAILFVVDSDDKLSMLAVESSSFILPVRS